MFVPLRIKQTINEMDNIIFGGKNHQTDQKQKARFKKIFFDSFIDFAPCDNLEHKYNHMSAI